MTRKRKTVSDVGEKGLIRDFIKPFFNADDDPRGVGDDCAMIEVGDTAVLLSTDRVPADLTAFRLGILDYKGLGDYLARLNLSDIASCGGRPIGLLLNLGLPSTIEYDSVKAICGGFRGQAEKWNCKVLGGDVTSSAELSISATSIGVAKKNEVLTRRGAKPGDSIFLSRPAGLTPAAFQFYFGSGRIELGDNETKQLRRQFTSMMPMIDLGRSLATSGLCTSCMDNTDGIGQSLTELAEASCASFSIDRGSVTIPELVSRIATQLSKDPIEFLFNGGADFSLIGTLKGEWDRDRARREFGDSIQIIGRVQRGEGVALLSGGLAQPLSFKGWNYFT